MMPAHSKNRALPDELPVGVPKLLPIRQTHEVVQTRGDRPVETQSYGRDRSQCPGNPPLFTRERPDCPKHDSNRKRDPKRPGIGVNQAKTAQERENPKPSAGNSRYGAREIRSGRKV